MSTPLLPEVVPELDPNAVSLLFMIESVGEVSVKFGA